MATSAAGTSWSEGSEGERTAAATRAPAPVAARDPAPLERALQGSGGPAPVAFGFLDCHEGGAQRLTVAACERLDRRRFAPFLLCARGGGRRAADARRRGLEVVELGRLRRPYDVAAVGLLAHELERRGTRILHLPLYSRASPYLRLAARRAEVPLVVAHEWSRPGRPSWSRRAADWWLRPGTCFVAASTALRRELVASGVRPAAVEVVHAGVDPRRFDPWTRSAARLELELDPARPVILVPARLHPVKGHDDLLAALPAMLERRPDLLVLCAGEGPRRSDLEARAERLGAGAAVRFLGHREDIPRLLAAADLVLLPSHVEGLPAALLEAMAARRAVVATAVGGVPEAVTNGVEGTLVPPARPDRLAAAVDELLRRPDVAAAMGERGRARVEREFGLDASTRRLEDLYTRWLAAR